MTDKSPDPLLSVEGGLSGLRVAAFESRRADEITRLIRSHGGLPLSAPALREVPLDDNPVALAFAEELFHGQFDMVIFLTGVGARALLELLETRHPRQLVVEAFRQVSVVARGPKPVRVLKEAGIHINVAVSEPNTTREILKEMDEMRAGWPLAGRRIAIQEYGAPNAELKRELEARGARVLSVPVYRWAMPENLEPLRAGIRAVSAGEVQVVIFTSAMQAVHLLQVAEQQGELAPLLEALKKTVIASIGPTTSAALRERHLDVDIEPEHPKMGFLLHAVAERAKEVLARKRAG